jgi:hypothetical protein
MIEKRAATEAEIAGELGGDLTAADRMLLHRAVELLTRKSRSHTDAVRLVNAGSRIINQLRAKYAKDEITPSLDELLAGAE